MDECRSPYLILFRGDDTDFSLNKAIRFTMTDSGFDLTGMTLHFFLLGIDKEFTDFSPERSCELTFSAEETKQFPVGTSLATLYLTDKNRKRHTLTTTLPVRVTLDADEAYLNVDVPVCFPMFNIGTCNINKLRCDVDRLIEAYNKAIENKQLASEAAKEISKYSEADIRNMSQDEQAELLIALQKYVAEDAK